MATNSLAGIPTPPTEVHAPAPAPALKPEEVVKLSDAERKKIREIVGRAKAFEAATLTCNPDYWRARQRSLSDTIEKTTDPSGLDDLLEELVEATTRRDFIKSGKMQGVKASIKHKGAAIRAEAIPILTAAADRANVQRLKDAKKLQDAQDAEHSEMGIDPAPCPGAVSLKAKANAVTRSARSMDLDSI